MKNNIFRGESKMVEEARQKKKGLRGILEILVFFAVFTVSQLLPGYVQSFLLISRLDYFQMAREIPYEAGFSAVYEYVMGQVAAAMSQPVVMIASLFATGLSTVVVVLFCVILQKRSLASMGFVKKRAVPDYLIGLAVGLAMFGLVVLLGTLWGGFRFEGMGGGRIPILLLCFLGYVIQGHSEETLCRGYFQISFARKNSMFWALILNGVLFGLLHVGNPGFGLLPFLNIVLFGWFMGLYFLKTESIWGVAAIHSIWNFAQGNLFGFSVSGTGEAESLLRFTSVGSKWITGGTFGPEGGLAVTAVLVIAILALLLWNLITSRKEKRD